MITKCILSIWRAITSTVQLAMTSQQCKQTKLCTTETDQEEDFPTQKQARQVYYSQ